MKDLYHGLIVSPSQRKEISIKYGIKDNCHKGKSIWEECPICKTARWVRLGSSGCICTKCNSLRLGREKPIYPSLSPGEYYAQFGIKVRGSMILYPCKKCGQKTWIRKQELKRKNLSGLCRECFYKYLHACNMERHKLNFQPFLRTKTGGGYIAMRIPKDDPFYSMTYNSGVILEHRYIMAQQLNRPLAKFEIVHHKNNDKTDNRIENLELLTMHDHVLYKHDNVCTRSYIRELENKVEALEKKLQEYQEVV